MLSDEELATCKNRWIPISPERYIKWRDDSAKRLERRFERMEQKAVDQGLNGPTESWKNWMRFATNLNNMEQLGSSTQSWAIEECRRILTDDSFRVIPLSAFIMKESANAQYRALRLFYNWEETDNKRPLCFAEADGETSDDVFKELIASGYYDKK